GANERSSGRMRLRTSCNLLTTSHQLPDISCQCQTGREAAGCRTKSGCNFLSRDDESSRSLDKAWSIRRKASGFLWRRKLKPPCASARRLSAGERAYPFNFIGKPAARKSTSLHAFANCWLMEPSRSRYSRPRG